MSGNPLVHASHANAFAKAAGPTTLAGTSTARKKAAPAAETEGGAPVTKKASSGSSSIAHSATSSGASSVVHSARGERDCERERDRDRETPRGSHHLQQQRTHPSQQSYAPSARADDSRRGSESSNSSSSHHRVAATAEAETTSSERDSALRPAGTRASATTAPSGVSSNGRRDAISRPEQGLEVPRDDGKHPTGAGGKLASSSRALPRDDRSEMVVGPRAAGSNSTSDVRTAASTKAGVSRDRAADERVVAPTAASSAGRVTGAQSSSDRALGRTTLATESPVATSSSTSLSSLTTTAGTSAGLLSPAKPKSAKQPKAVSRKKQSLLNEQSALTGTAGAAATLLAEKRALEAKIAAHEAQQAAEAQHATRVVEAARLFEQAADDQRFNAEREEVLVRLEESVYEAQAWDAFLRCNPLPDVANPAALNSFVSVFRENDTTNPPHLALEPALAACHSAELVVRELTTRLAAAREEKNDAAVKESERYTYLLRHLSQAKLASVTCRFLHRSDEYETGEECAFTQCAATDSLAYGLWVHGSSRTTRIKRIHFAAMGVEIELPQSLQKARTSIRAVRTSYDHVSITNAPLASRRGDATTGVAASASAPSLSRPGTRGDLLAAAISPIADASEEALTSPIALFDFDARPPPQDARAHFVSLGGVLELQQLLLPAPAKKIRSWMMREMTPLERQLVNVPYPAVHAGGISSASAAAPLRVTFALPQHIFLHDREPVLGYWDAAASQGRGMWRQDNCSIISFDPRTRVVSVNLPTIMPVACLQPRALDYPYLSWTIQPARDLTQYAEPSLDDESANACHLEVTGSRFSVCFEVRGLLARLHSPAHPFLARFRDEWSTPGALTAGLAEVGIRLTPSDADAAYCRKPLKAPLLVQTLHSHLALLTQVFDITSSPHNVSRSATSATFRVRLNRHSSLLASAAERRSVLDWEAAAEEDERLDREDKSYLNFPSSLREPSDEDRAAAQQQADIDAQIQAMEAEEAAEEARVRERERAQLEVATSISRSSSAGTKLKSTTTPPAEVIAPAAPVAANPEARYALGFEWVTVLAELIDAPSDPSLALAAAAAAATASSGHALPTSGRPLTAAERATGSMHEGLPSGVLLKFTPIRGSDAEGCCDPTPLAGQGAHFSLRRCLLAWFADKTPHDLVTAMSMAMVPGNAADGPASFSFLAHDARTLQTQQSVRRMLNLLRPFVFC